MNQTEIPVRTVTILEIRCSFCLKHRREDKKSDDPYDNQEYHFQNAARGDGWSIIQTQDNFVLTLCPDHTSVAKDMGLSGI